MRFFRRKVSRRTLRKLNRATSERWTVVAYDPELDEAPPGDPDHDCDGTHGDEEDE